MASKLKESNIYTDIVSDTRRCGRQWVSRVTWCDFHWPSSRRRTKTFCGAKVHLFKEMANILAALHPSPSSVTRNSAQCLCRKIQLTHYFLCFLLLVFSSLSSHYHGISKPGTRALVPSWYGPQWPVLSSLLTLWSGEAMFRILPLYGVIFVSCWFSVFPKRDQRVSLSFKTRNWCIYWHSCIYALYQSSSL